MEFALQRGACFWHINGEGCQSLYYREETGMDAKICVSSWKMAVNYMFSSSNLFFAMCHSTSLGDDNLYAKLSCDILVFQRTTRSKKNVVAGCCVDM